MVAGMGNYAVLTFSNTWEMKRMSRTALVLVLGLGLMAFGCGTDSDGDSGSTGGMGGDMGTGGMGGDMGTGGMGGDMGTGGAGGDTGTGGAGGDMGTGGAGGDMGTGGGGGAPGGGTIAAGNGTTRWAANTNNGGGAGTADGCVVFVDTIMNDIFIDVAIELDVTSDGSNNVTTDWTLTAQNQLLPVVQNLAEYGGLDVAAAVTGADGGPIASSAVESATGQLLSAFIDGTTLTFATPDEITQGSAALTPTSESVNVNWTGEYTLELEAGGMPLIVVDETVCTFDEQGAGVDFAVQ
jgi:hypothetical protein